MASELEQLVGNAGRDVACLIELFVRTRVHHYWPAAYTRIQDCLDKFDLDMAISLEKQVPKSGMGGLYDIHISAQNGNATVDQEFDNLELERLIIAVNCAFKSLRESLKYEY